jgi:predicted 2-oxoglutarate/Fe(II)-dependent dioxygenase YbiX
MVDTTQALQQLLAGLGEGARFESVGQLSAVLPGLEVKGIGSIGIPVAPADAKRIIGKASQAPYGRGEATIVDTEVRRVWQSDSKQFDLRNTAWNDAVASVVDAVKRDLGIRGKVTAELYKLLVYEKGSFFRPHRDTEKTPGMFGTLVVCLPSRHEGGTLILEHDGQTKQIDFGGKDSEFQTRYVAFYADCRHEVTPVKSGYRVCLVYNLASAGKKQPAAPHHAEAVAEAARLIKKLFSAPEPLNKLAIPFTHQYTEASFDPKQLKGADRARAEVLIRAAQSLDYECNFALLMLHQEGIPDYGTIEFGDSWGRQRSRWSHDDYDEADEDEEDSSEDSDGEFEEIFNEELKLEHWRDPEGREQSFGTIHFEDNEILGLDDKEGWSYKQEVREATGNEGASMDRWYRHAVLVIWPRERHFEVLAGEGPASAIPALEKLVAQSKTAQHLAACGKVAKAIIEHWEGHDPYRHGSRTCSGPMLRALERIGDAKLAMRFLRDVLPKSFNGSEGRALNDLCQCIGWKTLAPAIQEFLAHQKPADYGTHLNQIVTICEHLCCDPPALSKERRAACGLIADELMKAVVRWDKVPPNRWDSSRFGAYQFREDADDFDEDEGDFDEDDDEMEDEDKHDAEPKRKPSEDEQEALTLQQRGNKRIGIVASMVRLLSAIGASEQLTAFHAHVLADARHYDLRSVVIPDVKSLYAQAISTAAGRHAAARLLQHCITELRDATAQPPEPPKDWKREAKLGCKCEDCAALSRFLRDPAERVGRFPMNKQRRQHLHRQIDQHRCDVTHVTERKGSPQTLVCTKTQNSYEHSRKQYDVDQLVLVELGKLEGAPSRRIRKSS